MTDLIKIKGLGRKRHRKYPCMMALTKAETKMLLDDQYQKIRLRKSVKYRKNK